MTKTGQILTYSAIIILTSCMSVISFLYFQNHFLSKNEIIFVRTDLFDSELRVPIEFFKDEQYILNHMKNNVYDTDFKLAVFYSECAYQLLTESENAYYYDIFLRKSMDKWDMLIAQDSSMEYFKTIYLDKILKYYVQKTSK